MREKIEAGIERFIFGSRWIQAPLYLCLIFASLLYSYKFIREVIDLTMRIDGMNKEAVMLGVLDLIDATMVLNLVVIVTIGGYSEFVSKINLTGHKDRPDWLEHITASTLKIKLSASLVGISGIHLLRTFIDLDKLLHIEHITDGVEAVGHGAPEPEPLSLAERQFQRDGALDYLLWQVLIHMVFLGSSLFLSLSEWILNGRSSHTKGGHGKKKGDPDDHKEHTPAEAH